MTNWLNIFPRKTISDGHNCRCGNLMLGGKFLGKMVFAVAAIFIFVANLGNRAPVQFCGPVVLASARPAMGVSISGIIGSRVPPKVGDHIFVPDSVVVARLHAIRAWPSKGFEDQAMHWKKVGAHAIENQVHALVSVFIAPSFYDLSSKFGHIKSASAGDPELEAVYASDASKVGRSVGIAPPWDGLPNLTGQILNGCSHSALRSVVVRDAECFSTYASRFILSGQPMRSKENV